MTDQKAAVGPRCGQELLAVKVNIGLSAIPNGLSANINDCLIAEALGKWTCG
jgi:hypothetical protein